MPPTPFLDRLTPLPAPVPPGRGARIIVAVSAAASVAILTPLVLLKPALVHDVIRVLQARVPDLFDRPWTAARIVVTIASVLFAMVAVVGLHECGHVVGGLLAGFGFQRIAIGPIVLDSRFRISLHFGAAAWSGGWVSLYPVARDRMRWRAIALVAGGPLVCIVVGAAGVLAGAIAGPGSAVFFVGSLVSVTDLLPVRPGLLVLDGFRILSLLRHDAWARRWLALITVTAELRKGVAPEELPPEVIAALTALQDESGDTSIAYAVAYSASFYSGDDERSAALLETCLRFSGYAQPQFRAALLSDAAVFQGRRRKRADLAASWANDLPATGPEWLLARAQAAVLEARGERLAAPARLDDVERAVTTLPMPTEEQRRMAIRLLGRWKAELSGAS